MNNSKGSLPISWQRITLIALCVILTLILAVMIYLTGYVHRILNAVSGDGHSINATLSPEDLATATEYYDPSIPPTGPSTEPFTQSTVPAPPIVNTDTDHISNSLLIGEDRRPGQVRQRSDSMILCSFNTKNNTLTMVSFLRDIYISQIPGYASRGPQKLNAAYQFGGAYTLDETLASYFGVRVDSNVAVQFDGFVGIIDMLGGVDIELTEKEAKYLNELGGWKLTAGMQHLDGKKALAYTRIRKIDMDAMRAQRQRKLLTALINRYRDHSLPEMLSLASDIVQTGFVKTSMTSSELTGYIVSLFPILSSANIRNQQIPAENTYTLKYIAGLGECKIPDLEKNRKILQQILN